MELTTTYRAKGREIGLVFLFKYSLNGDFKLFEIAEGTLNAQQMKWLFAGSNFPANESMMRSVWMKEKKYRDVFEIEKSVADVSFDSLWNLYNHKVKRVEAEKQFQKLKEADVIKCFLAIPGYHQYLQQKKVAQAHLSTFINQRYYEDEWSKAINN